MAKAQQSVGSSFWELLNEALHLQHSATCLAEAGETDEAAGCERRALSLLLQATCRLEAEEPALVTVRRLAASGMARLHALNRHGRPATARPRRKRVLSK